MWNTLSNTQKRKYQPHNRQYDVGQRIEFLTVRDSAIITDARKGAGKSGCYFYDSHIVVSSRRF